MQATYQEETAAFAQWIIDIGDGIIGDENDGYATIEISQELLITKYNDPIHSIISSTFPDLSHHHNDPEYFQTRAILASTNETDAIEIPGFYQRQWLPNYPEIVEFKYDGETYEIQVRQHNGKLYFADGLTRLRIELQIYESQLPASVTQCLIHCGDHMTILRRFGPPLQWNVVGLDKDIGDKYVSLPWYKFLQEGDFNHGDELSFYYRRVEKIWELIGMIVI
ncbi:uncharacterized protein [Glycine max]|uniref:uncharacterized protein n=1 Tax=Glycine max TaxID=3847 RepID=UPI0007191A63|nr:uncharacterized protein LOC106799237 [Glycine max]|eukprot:XP_014632909.1 uncharacterized protein LOC106799237 [Glycine max]